MSLFLKAKFSVRKIRFKMSIKEYKLKFTVLSSTFINDAKG